jgi:hypothetical protein
MRSPKQWQCSETWKMSSATSFPCCKRNLRRIFDQYNAKSCAIE